MVLYVMEWWPFLNTFHTVLSEIIADPSLQCCTPETLNVIFCEASLMSRDVIIPVSLKSGRK